MLTLLAFLAGFICGIVVSCAFVLWFLYEAKRRGVLIHDKETDDVILKAG